MSGRDCREVDKADKVEGSMEAEEEEDSKADSQEDLQEMQPPANSG